MKLLLPILLMVLSVQCICAQDSKDDEPECLHPDIGTTAAAPDGGISLRLVGKRQNYCADSATRCRAIVSPKSVHISPDGRKYYVNSLEGAKTVVFDAATNDVLTTISHRITARHDSLWAPPRTDFYTFTHYDSIPNPNHFTGKPVESAFSHGGRYLWVPYYRRSFDINAQDPSACAVIDTEADTIVHLFETGPLPKMIAASPDGRYMAISHWGDNTVALLDISSANPADWHHKQRFVVDYVLPLDYSTTEPVDRDTGSGYALRGTVFTPDSRYLLVGCMGHGGGIAVMDVDEGKYLGRVTGMMPNVRHLLIDNGMLYLSINKGGYVQRIALDDFLAAAATLGPARSVRLGGWESAKVGAGARTIEVSPDGRYIFAACNTVSKIVVVDTQTMQAVCEIDVDSYPVGLDISADGRRLYTTSQGRNDKGGNAVDIYEVTYGHDAPVDTVAPAGIAVAAPAEAPNAEKGGNSLWLKILAGLALAALVLIIVYALRRKP